MICGDEWSLCGVLMQYSDMDVILEQGMASRHQAITWTNDDTPYQRVSVRKM